MAEQITIEVLAKDLASEVLKGLGLNMEGLAAEALPVVGIFASIVAAELQLASGAGEAAQEMARLDIALKNSGNAVGITKDELASFTTQLSRSAGIEDDLIVKSEAMAVTLGIHGNEIKKVVQAAADLSALEGGDLVSNTQKVAKAMSNFEGYTVLGKVFEKLTDAQKEQIKKYKEANDLIGYQAYIMDVLNGKVGGMAAAVEDAGTGQGRLNVELKSLADNIGALLLPEVKDLTSQLTILLRVINDNFVMITNLWQGVDNLHRAIVGVSSLGLSEGFRAIFRGGGEAPATTPHATGGSWVVPAGYGNEGYPMGGGHTASAGETITVTPAGGSGGHSISIGTLNIGNTSGMSRGDITDMMGEALTQAISRRS